MLLSGEILKICYLADGGSIHTFRYMKFFVDQGHEVSLISLRDATKEIKNLGIKIYNLNVSTSNFLLKSIRSLIKIPKVLKILKKINPDVLHTHDIFVYGLYAYLSGKKYVLTPWGTDILIMPKKIWVYRMMLPLIFSKAHYIVYEGDNILDSIIRYCSSKKKVKLIRFGIDTKFFSKEKASNSLKKKFEEKVLIVSTRHLEPVYDIETYVKAAAKVLENNKKIHFLIIGEGSQKQTLVNLAKNLRISKHITFVGKLSPDDMSIYLASSDIYVSTSLSDGGIATSTAEAMSCGLPVVISDFGDNFKWIKPNINGFLFKARDVLSLSNHLKYLIGNPSKRILFGENNSNLILEKQDYYTAKKSLEKLYKKIKDE